MDDHEEIVEVGAIRLDELLRAVSRVDVVKVDVEGAEYRACAGMRRTLDSNPEISIAFEWSPGQVQLWAMMPRS